ncbi:MAG: glycosyl hydrolase family 65 protein [Verrucomicrobiales bacterium]|nr:glycosyl hydrolase family 65 protein [Verrucomicrobiales bacterium]
MTQSMIHLRNQVVFDRFEPDQLNQRESLLTLSNTYLGLRGVEDEDPAGSLPGLYIAGLFDKSECLVPEIVNFPAFLQMSVEVDGSVLNPAETKIESYERRLDMERAAVHRTIVYCTNAGRRIRVDSIRYVSFADQHCGAIQWVVTPLNFSGTLRIHTAFDASRLSREGSYHYDEAVKHYTLGGFNDQYEENLTCRVILRDTGLPVDLATCLVVSGNHAPLRQRRLRGEVMREQVELPAQEDVPLTVTKYFVVADGRSFAPATLRQEVVARLERMKAAGFDEEWSRSAAQLQHRWQGAGIVIEGDEQADLAVRFNIFQLLGLGHETRSDFSIGAKGLTNERYGGHYFWDTEIYLLPFYLHTAPGVARNLLDFRARTLDRAKTRARAAGFEGCLWPWQSDSVGEEGIRNIVRADGTIHVREILEQYHIVSDVAYACLEHLRYTGDTAFFVTRLSPLIVEALRFWRSFLRACNPPNASQYHLRSIMGPDEYHRHVDDNYYTNFLTKLIFRQFAEFYRNATPKQQFDVRRLNALTDVEIEELTRVGEGIHLPELRANVIEQFAGYFQLLDLTVAATNERGLPVYPAGDVGRGLPQTEQEDALQAHATTTQLIKQADAVLLLVLVPDQFTPEIIRASYDYYSRRTLHFSSLSPGTCALAALRAGRQEEAERLFFLGSRMDLDDIKKETANGLHTACHGATYRAVVEGFAGVRITPGQVSIEPSLPVTWRAVELPLIYRGLQLRLRITAQEVTVTLPARSEVAIRYRGRTTVLRNPTELPDVQRLA